jgi:thiamine pyrophosphate-dependent acetolactate synthase large subunit-like protein
MKVPAAVGLARILKAEGVSWVSTFPISPVNNGLGQEGVPMLMMRDERFAVAVADAYSRITCGQKIGACSFGGGVNAAGLQFAYGAVAQAFEESSPVLCLAEGVPLGATDNSHYDPDLGFHAVTKWIGNIDLPQRVPEIMRRAFTLLRTGRPGPVMVTLPRGVGDYDEAEYPYVPVKGWRSGPDPDDVRAAVKALLAAKRPLVYVGEGVFYGDATAELLQFAELAQVPVLATLKGKSAFPENHALSVGVRGELASHFLRGCDVLLAIGASLSPGRFGHAVPEAANKTIIQCTVDELDINKKYPVQHALIGHAKYTLQALIDELSRQTGGGVKKNQALLTEIETVRAEFQAKYQGPMTSNDKPINPYRVYADLRRVLDPVKSCVTHDSGNTRDQISTTYEAVSPRSFVGWGNISSLGFGLPTAMAAKLAHPDWQCVNVTGDAGVGYMMGNFEAVVRNRIGVTTVHINNGGFAGYGPGFWGGGHDPYTWEVSDHSVADYSAAVKAIGYYSEDITEPAEIIPSLERAFAENAQGRPAYLEFICNKYPVFGKFEGPGGG